MEFKYIPFIHKGSQQSLTARRWSVKKSRRTMPSENSIKRQGKKTSNLQGNSYVDRVSIALLICAERSLYWSSYAVYHTEEKLGWHKKKQIVDQQSTTFQWSSGSKGARAEKGIKCWSREMGSWRTTTYEHLVDVIRLGGLIGLACFASPLQSVDRSRRLLRDLTWCMWRSKYTNLGMDRVALRYMIYNLRS